MASTLATALRQVPGARQVLQGIWLLEGETSRDLMASSSLLLEGREPVLVDAGMRPQTAAALRDTGVVARLHLTHKHLDHRRHQAWFDHVPVSGPALEVAALTSWDAWLTASGLEGSLAAGVLSWIESLQTIRQLPQVVGLVDGEPLPPGADFPVIFIALPGHTRGHSGLWFPEQKAMLVTDYDMEKFGPWYANATSDLDAYEASLRSLMARTDIAWFITSHGRGVLGPQAFRQEAARYLTIIANRTRTVVERLRAGPATAAALAAPGLAYPRRLLARNPLFAAFDTRHVELHLQRLAREGRAQLRDDGRWHLV